MKKFSFLMAGAMFFAFTGAVNAASATYFDIDQLGTKLSKNGTKTLNGTFDITASGIEGDSYTIGAPYFPFWAPRTFTDVGGFIPGQSTIASATVYFAVRDDQLFDKKEYMNVKLGNIKQGKFEIDLAILGFDVEASLIGDLNDSGQLSYRLASKKGDFYVDYAAIEVNTLQSLEDKPEIVPLPAASWAGFLMLAGLAAARKYLRK